jgi:Domain of unknown function (DUF1818)
MDKVLKSGLGWRMGWNPHGNPYQGLVGGEDWAFELTGVELEDFCRLLTQLADNMRVLATEIMEEERVACEAESGAIWMQVEGFPHRYSLRLLLNTGRACEGNWSAEIVPDLLSAAQSLKFF